MKLHSPLLKLEQHGCSSSRYCSKWALCCQCKEKREREREREQAQSQLKAIYKDHADTIIGNCDSTLFLGGKEKGTLKEISELLGKETIDLYNTSETRSNQKSFGLNYQKLGKELMSQDEIAVMDGGKCIFQLRGVRPFISNKFDIIKHKNYKLLEDYDKKNLFNIEEYIKRNGEVKLKKDSMIARLLKMCLHLFLFYQNFINLNNCHC